MLMWSTVEVLKSTPSCAEAAVPVAARAASPRTRSRRLSEPFSKRATRLEIIDSMAVSFRAGWTWRKDHSAPRHGAQGRGAVRRCQDPLGGYGFTYFRTLCGATSAA